LLNFCRIYLLPQDTDLKVAPSNWLHSHPSGADSLEGFSATHHYTAFSSFKMAINHMDHLKVGI
jgi:hypothetical protein